MDLPDLAKLFHVGAKADRIDAFVRSTAVVPHADGPLVSVVASLFEADQSLTETDKTLWLNMTELEARKLAADLLRAAPTLPENKGNS